MTSVPPSRHRVAGGFSLLEVVIAAGLLLLTVASVSVAVANVSHAGRRAEAAMRVDAALESELARLASLPFCAVTLPSVPVGDPTAATDLLGAVFPDAGGPRDSADARYVVADEGGVPGGSFVTRFDQDGVSITCVARFRHRPAGSVADGRRPRRVGPCGVQPSACGRCSSSRSQLRRRGCCAPGAS